MEGFETVQNFFCSMHCSNCNNYLKPDGITLVKEENNFFVVKIVCVDCDQPIGLAIVGVSNKEDFIKPKGAEVQPVVTKDEPPPITYDEVIDAHQFFSNLGSDWSKHLQNSAIDLSVDESEETTQCNNDTIYDIDDIGNESDIERF